MKETIKHDYFVVSFSGGKDSTAMLLKLCEEKRQIDEIIFCDTGKEFPELLKHIQKVQSMINRKITILKSEKTFDWYLSERTYTNKKGERKEGYGWPSMHVRWCTKHLKIQVIDNYLNEIKKKFNIKQYIGIAYDEQKRIGNDPNIIYPLNELKMTEKQALDYCYSKGLDWGGLYKLFGRTSCWCCPLQSLHDLRTLREYFPKIWTDLLKMNEKTKNSTMPMFQYNYTLEQLDIRFKLEEDCKEKGLKINDKSFFKMLRNKLKE